MEKKDFVIRRLQAMKEKKESLETVAVYAGTSRRTLTNIMNGEGAQTKTVDKLYNYFKGVKK